MADIEVTNHGTIFTFRPLTRHGKDWLDENLVTEPWQHLGPTIAVEHRYAAEIVEGLLAGGLRVR